MSRQTLNGIEGSSTILLRLLAVLGLAAGAAACNVFDPLDTPTSDEQIVSKARACFDAGDLDCAREWYGKLSNGYADIRNSEEAFVILHENGITMPVFINAVTGGQGGGGLTKLANSFSWRAGETRRLALYEAYKKVPYILQPQLRGLTRFVTAYALAAEILAEDAGTDYSLQKDDLVSSSASCSCTACACTGGCAAAASSILTPAARVDLVNFPTSSDLTGTPTLGMIDGALDAVNRALVYELTAAGSFADGAGGFSTSILSTASTVDDCYRYTLISNGVGQ